MFKALVVLCLVALAVAKEASKCETKFNIVDDDWKAVNADDSKPTERHLCFFKCVYEDEGSVNSDGVLNADKLVENVHKWKPLTDDAKNSIKECVKSLGPVKTCNDVSPSYQCVQNALAKQKKGTA
ncbi:uncharacterized protein LOC123688874 [Harmonia axyridis]|uniref:Odorant binding protein 18 n=1 Tax=Harmonia axyridis TaxID=115357 RepID=A0A8J9RCW8_HARAX|nr:uncharacterized protein LOC123688874 [Harmonia axyridis]AVH84916.1 odorant binding protein 9 [Harmonia axyridis]QTE76126.1 odorant binding protein 18 [Harmonia axyridis]